MNSPQPTPTSPLLTRASAERLVSYGVAQIAKSPELAVNSIMQGLSQHPDQKLGILAIACREGQLRVKVDTTTARLIESSKISPEEKVFIRTLYQFCCKDGSLAALPDLAQKAYEANMKATAAELVTYFFVRLKSGQSIQNVEPLIQGLSLFATAAGDLKVASERHSHERTFQNAVGVAAQLGETQFRNEPRLTAALRGAEATIASMRVARSVEENEQLQTGTTGYAPVKAGFNFREALRRLQEEIKETNLVPIEEAANSLPARERRKVLASAYALFTGESLTPAIRRRSATLTIEIDSEKLREIDTRLSKETNPDLQREREQRAQKLHDFKVAELQQRITELPDDVRPRIELSEAFRLEGQIDLALKTLQQAATLRMEPSQRKLIDMTLGDLFFARQQYRIALRAYESVTGSDTPEEIAKKPTSLEFSALIKRIATLQQLSALPQGEVSRQNALTLVEPLYLLFSEVHPEVHLLYQQLTAPNEQSAAL